MGSIQSRRLGGKIWEAEGGEKDGVRHTSEAILDFQSHSSL